MSAYEYFEFKGKLYRVTWPTRRLSDGREIVPTRFSPIDHHPSAKEAMAAMKAFRRRQDKQAGHA